MWVYGTPCWLLCRALQLPAWPAARAPRRVLVLRRDRCPGDYFLALGSICLGLQPSFLLPMLASRAASCTVNYKVKEVGKGRICAELWALPQSSSSGMKG